MNIGYTTEICKPYVDGVKKCKSRTELAEFIQTYWKELAYDALEAVKADGFSWNEYKAGLRKEKKGEYSGDEWAGKYSAILMPAVILFIGLNAQRFCVPDGVVFIQGQKAGVLKQNKGGIYYLDFPKESQEGAENG